MINRNICSFLTIAATGAMIASGCGGGRAAVPSSYKAYHAKDGCFKIDYPTEWAVEGGGAGVYAWAKFTSGSASIAVNTSLVGSLLGDLANATSQMIAPKDDDEDHAPAAVVHERERETFEQTEGVKEQTPTTIKAGWGKARRAEHTGSKNFGGAIHRHRATILSPDYRIRVICQCPESEWAALKPVFEKVIESVSRGKAGG
jgi:hypothetical protein